MRTILTVLLIATTLLLTTPPAKQAQKDGRELKPFTFDHRGSAGSVIDLSTLHDAPAGKRGFARVANGHLVTGDGKRLRLWGVNITDWTRTKIAIRERQSTHV